MSATVALGFASVANAENGVERSGNTFHVAACGPVPAGFARCHARVVTDASGQLVEHDLAPVGGFGPSDLRSAYKIKATGKSKTIVALVDAYGYTNAETDLGVYRSNFGLPACTTQNGCFQKLNQNGQQGNYPAQNIGWAQESALDVDMASAMCPNCQIWLVEANDSSYNNLATAENTAASLGAHVISNSYGGGESGTQSFESAYNHANVAVTASTGDNGFAAGPQFPATSPPCDRRRRHASREGQQQAWLERNGLERRRQRLQHGLCQAHVAARPDLHKAHGSGRFGRRRSGDGAWRFTVPTIRVRRLGLSSAAPACRRRLSAASMVRSARRSTMPAACIAIPASCST